ncbi:FMN-binding split barrel-like protein [Penicillium alfredii]|uniref:FMN-binding split barrel-like protein n=1 Tax=Penicillium alfredii TaxID=1506179 RepID=A0A9W9JYW5_9EURO|nr:FMN-binding split barrel-like protein [Penicillium alfredii]KAJ5086743.1 FMN-binding split barrel-like protein [Penicillium alfredii]
MQLALSRVAQARRGLGVPLCLDTAVSSSIRSLCPLRSGSPARYYQHQLLYSRRHNSNATAPPKARQQTPSPQTTAGDPNPQHTTTTRPQPTGPLSPTISDHVRLLMRRVPYPVAIITATDPAGPPDTTAFRGMTVSSFNTVTLTPHPVISFNVRRPSETLNALLASGRFLVHLLAPGPATATLARDFSKGNTALAAMLSGHGEFEFAALAAEAGAESQAGESQRPLPILQRRNQSLDSSASARDQPGFIDGADFPFVLECTLHPQKIDVHDHSIVLGTVIRAVQDSDVTLSNHTSECVDSSENSPDRMCLTYANTRFWKMGSTI